MTCVFNSLHGPPEFCIARKASPTLQEENFHWNLNVAILLIANSLHLNFAYYCIFGNHSKIPNII